MKAWADNLITRVDILEQRLDAIDAEKVKEMQEIKERQEYFDRFTAWDGKPEYIAKRVAIEKKKIKLATEYIHYYITGKQQGNNGHPIFGLMYEYSHPSLRELIDEIQELEKK